MNYKKYLLSKHWKDFKKDYFSKFKKICYKCGSVKRIHLHHKVYKNLWCEKYVDVIPLCNYCHAKTHNKIPKEIKEHKIGVAWGSAIKKAQRQLEMNSKRLSNRFYGYELIRKYIK